MRPHGPARALHRAHRRHADRARRQRLPLGRARGGGRVCARGQRPHPGQAAGGRREAGAAVAGQRRAGARRAAGCRAGGGDPDRLRSVLVVQTRVELVPWGSLRRSEYKSKLVEPEPRGDHAEAPEPGRPPHHHRRRRPADVDRLLGGRAGHAVRVRAAEPRQRVREPPLLRPGRRAADHDLHQRGAGARPRRARRPTRAACTTSRSRSPRPRSPRRSSGSTSAGSATAASRTAGSWTRSTSPTRSGC